MNRCVFLKRDFWGPFFCLVFVNIMAASASFAAPVTWEEQAERLQNVSASLLDGAPVGEPLQNTSAEVRAVVSFLPKVNSKIGSKSEKVPSSPVHAVPTLQFNAVSGRAFGVQLWGGYLPPGGEKLFGIKAKLSQWQVGGAVQGILPLQGFELFLPVGFQMGKATLTGPITAADSDDDFVSTTRFLYLAPGVRFPALNVWAGVLVANKNTKSEFKISSEGTNLSLIDMLSDSSFPYVTQASVGWFHASGVQLAVSELFVPKRVTMPRLLVSYQYSLGK